MTEKKLKERRARILKLDKELAKVFPEARIELDYSNPWELMVAVILSAQSTDKKVNEITAKLFKKYKKLGDYVKAGSTAKGVEGFEEAIRQSGFYRMKAKNILASAKKIKEEFGGEVPRTMEEMLKLPGVARKSANVILGSAYGVVEGIGVDTHVMRLAQKFDLTDYKDPVRIEKDLMEILPKRMWLDFNRRFVLYGRHTCPRRKHDGCEEHPLTKIYPRAAKIWP